MDRSEFLDFIIKNKKLDKKVFDLSKKITDFPACYSILIKLDGSDFINTILNPSTYGEIAIAGGDIKKHNEFKNRDIREKALKFIDDLVERAQENFTYQTYADKNEDISDYVTIGIDLGTTNTIASYTDEDGKANSIPMKNGERILPSVVAVVKGKGKKLKFEVGQNAIWQQKNNPLDTFYSVKRFIGRRTSEVSPSLISKYPYKIELDQEKVGISSPKLKRRIEIEEISAQILMTVKENSEQFLGKKVKDCVITVPAYFDNNQRVATKNAAEIAGLNVLRLISEPTAAAFAYDISKKGTNSNTLVLDLGGGTFDISLVRSEGTDLDSFSVIHTLGERELGGDDYTSSIEELIIEKMKESESTINLDQNVLNLIREEANKAKHLLSFQEEIELNFPHLPTSSNGIVSYSCSLTRKEFETSCTKINDQLASIIKKFLAVDKVKKNKFTKVVLVGGASRMPVFTNLVKKLTKLKPQIDINPDEVVSHGAAYCGKYSVSAVVEKTIIDVTPLTLGVYTLGDIFSPLISSNTALPTRKSKDFTTAEDYQKNVDIRVYQGERKIASDNIFLDNFKLFDIQRSRAGVPSINVTFQIDMDGILTVTAIDKSTKAKQSIEITNSLNLGYEEIEKLKKIALQMADEDIQKKVYSEKVNDLFNWKKQFDDLPETKLSTKDKLIIDKVETCIDKIHKSDLDPDELIFSLRRIIREQKNSRAYASA